MASGAGRSWTPTATSAASSAAQARQATPSASDDDENNEPDLPAHINALDCPTPDEAIIDKPLLLRCAVAANLPVAAVVLVYRAPGKDGYTDTVMTRSPKGWLQAKIPKKAVTGKSIQFYFEGRNANGKPVVANGGADSPNIVLLVEESSAGETEQRRRAAERTRTRWRTTKGRAGRACTSATSTRTARGWTPASASGSGGSASASAPATATPRARASRR